MQHKFEKLAEHIQKAENIAVFTGAGISTESGIPDFRSANGVWTLNKTREEVMSRQFLESKPKEFWPIFKDIFQIKLGGNYEPNFGHNFLVELEKMGKNVTILTQNVDGLHTKAGSSKVYEIHGSIQEAFCPKCKTKYDLEYIKEHEIPRCSRINKNGDPCHILHPGVVLFGQNIKHFDEALNDALESDLFIVVGSSLLVSPVNQIPALVAARWKAKMVIVNKDETHMDQLFDLVINAKIGNTFFQVSELLKK